MTQSTNRKIKEAILSRRAARMSGGKRKDRAALGPRITKKAVLYFLGFCLILDLIGYTISRAVFDVCYGVLCLL